MSETDAAGDGAQPRDPVPDGAAPGDRHGPARWDGRPGRLEVWYATLTDPATGHGCWLHHELVAATDGTTRAHGWTALFPPDAPPAVARYGPEVVAAPAPATGDAWYDAAGARVGPSRMVGEAPGAAWDLRYHDDAPPLFTFPEWAWDGALLPAAQIVPWPTLTATGTVTVGEQSVRLEAARGAQSRIYGHGNANRWGWLHADLGGGDVLEVVAAQGRRPGLRAVPPRAILRLRLGGEDWPADPVAAALASRVRLDLPRWYATVTTPTRRLRLGVRIPPVDSVTLEYRDPDDASAQCTNSCRADAEIRLERRAGGRWREEGSWSLRATAHAEVGQRP